MAASRRWLTIVVKVVLVVVVTTALTAECNQTVARAATGHKTVGDDGIATMKSWGQVGDVVNEEWDEAPHSNGGVGDHIVGVAKKATSMASNIINEASTKAKDKCQQTKEGCDIATEKVKKSFHDEKDKVMHGSNPKTRQNNEEL